MSFGKFVVRKCGFGNFVYRQIWCQKFASENLVSENLIRKIRCLEKSPGPIFQSVCICPKLLLITNYYRRHHGGIIEPPYSTPPPRLPCKSLHVTALLLKGLRGALNRTPNMPRGVSREAL